MDEKNVLKKFSENFFKNIQCEVVDKGDFIQVDKIPLEFEKMYGKKSPYMLVFDREIHEKNKDSELVTKGSFILKVMIEYLENRAQMTLLKLDLNHDLRIEIINHLDMNDFEILNLKEKHKNEYFTRFMFLTNFYYLNEKEQEINHVLIKDHNLMGTINLEQYHATNGKKEEIEIKDVKEDYNIAKENLKNILCKKTSEISKYLNQSLEIESRRIKSHYMHQIDEEIKEIQKNKNNLKIFEEKLNKSKDKEIYNERIAKTKQTLERLEKENNKEKFEKEESFLINDEKHKHSLNINNSLMNTTIFYYPIYNYSFSFRKKNLISNGTTISYDPFKRIIGEIKCESCKKDIKKINVCSMGHVSCENCIKTCPNCRKETCEACMKVSCKICGRGICQKCLNRCFKCLNYTCSSDIVKDYISNRNLCTKCAKYCFSCKKHSDAKNFNKCSKCNKEICIKCSKLDFDTKKYLCINCYKTPDFLKR